MGGRGPFRRDFRIGAFRSDPEEEVREEIAFYLEERARELEAEGMDPEAAREAAVRAFGDRDRIEAEVRGIAARRRSRRNGGGVGTMIESWTRDVRFGLRTALRNPGLTAVVVLTLGLGIGASTAIFSVVDAALLRALPFPDADRLVFLQGYAATPTGPQIRGASFPEVADWREGSRSFTDVSAVDGISLNLTGGTEAERVNAEMVEPSYVRILGGEALVGRTFLPEERGPPDAHPVVLLGEDLWERRFDADPGVVGRAVRLNDRAVTVVGVLPRSFQGTTLQAELWVTPSMVTLLRGPDEFEDRGSRWLGAVARLAPGVTVEEAQRDLDAVAGRLTQRFPETNTDRGVQVTAAREVYLGSSRTLVLILMGAVGLLLLIACANVTNLLLVRAASRGDEVRMRLALGAGRRRVLRQLLTESLVLGALGTGAGLVLALWGVRALRSVIPPTVLPSFVEVGLDARVFLFAAGLLALTGVLSGLAPALAASGMDPAAGMTRSRGGTGGASRLRRVLVVGEVALALVLLVGAGLMVRSLRSQLAVEPGFAADELLAFRAALPRESYTREELLAFVDELRLRLESVPGVRSAAVGSDLPLRGGSSAAMLTLEGREEDPIRFYRHRVGEGYLSTLGIPLLRGRDITGGDVRTDADVVVISDAMARRFFPDEDPVGRRILLGDMPWTIVGVAGDVRFRDLTTDLVTGGTDPDVYLPFLRAPTPSLEVAVRAEGDPAALTAAVRRVVRELDPGIPLFQVAPLSQALDAQTAQARFGSFLLGLFGALALVLAAVGLYGVLAYAVGQRSREIAIRMAVGARAADVRLLVAGQGMRLAGIGLVVGVSAALALNGVLSGFLFRVRPTDPATYAGVTLLMGAVALAASALPAWRATRLDPNRALKAE